MSTKAEIITVKCEACITTADAIVVRADELGRQWNTLPVGWFERGSEPFHARVGVCSRRCLVAVLALEAPPAPEIAS